MSVSAAAVRPTGPAVADASAPIVNLLDRSLSIAPSFITSMTTSVSEPPIWKPTLPPSTLSPAGADQPRPGLRQTMKPRPYLAPTTKAPFFTPGTTTTQAALPSKSCGMPLSGAPIMSLRTLAAASSRFSVSFAKMDSAINLPGGFDSRAVARAPRTPFLNIDADAAAATNERVAAIATCEINVCLSKVHLLEISKRPEGQL